MSARRATLASAGRVFRGLLDANTWLWLFASVVLATLCASAVDSATDAWNTRGPLLMLPLWLPGLCVAIRLRHVLPALGAGDSAIAWAELRAWGRLPLRLGAALGACSALCVLTVATSLAVAVGASFYESPEFLHATQLVAVEPPSQEARRSKATRRGVLLADGDVEYFRLAGGEASTLRLEPQYYFGTEANSGRRRVAHRRTRRLHSAASPR